ncbi:FadR/GntR family transcriptional regulator [Microbacterium sp. NPDC056044]|uniref:FadR/GntR family transcriptional regulator n=1 Tax=Microbacterium sp. NPDC056044 TaxID=3345690 RepID=UPI0035E2C835
MAETPHRSPVHDSLVERLGAAIVHGAYPAGSRLLTADLAEASGASRSAAREAVRVLESLGLVQVRRKAGIEVLPVGQWNVYAPEIIAWRLDGPGRARQLQELNELRGAVEPLAARLAAVHATDAQRQELVAAALSMAGHHRQAAEAEYLDADVRFHRTLLGASGNPMLGVLGGVVQAVLEGRTRHALMPHEANPDAVRWHRDVAFAVAGGEADAAFQAMSRIVGESEAAMGEAVDGELAEIPGDR